MSDLKTGDKVVHQMFGAGVIASIAGSGPDARITVDFAPSVGRKKLQAGVANLRLADAAESSSSLGASFVEALDATTRPRAGKRVDVPAHCLAITLEVGRAEFWVAVRDRLRARGQAPKVIDDPSGHISISASGSLNLRIRIKHESINDARESLAAQVIAEELADRLLRNFDRLSTDRKPGLQHAIDEENLVFIEETELEDLPDREMRMRPKKVQPKGVFKSIPKRRDDY